MIETLLIVISFLLLMILIMLASIYYEITAIADNNYKSGTNLKIFFDKVINKL